MNGILPQINIIIPLYNEEESFPYLIKRLDEVIKKSEHAIEVILIDDGSSDSTSFLMHDLSKKNKNFTSIFLSRNFGHQYALSAGLSYVNASEAIFIIDGDLQDPPELLFDFFEKIQEGYDVVYAIREKRKEGFLKKIAYKAYYRILSSMASTSIPLDSGDFSMMSRRVVDYLNDMPEQSRFLRGMRSWVGFKQIGINYERSQRDQGSSKYSLSDLLKLAFNGLFNFSEFPIRFISRLGILTFLIAFIYLTITLIKKYFFGEVPEGFTAVITLIILFGGVQLIAIGIIGEYVLRTFFQVKNRPLFIIKSEIRNGILKKKLK